MTAADAETHRPRRGHGWRVTAALALLLGGPLLVLAHYRATFGFAGEVLALGAAILVVGSALAGLAALAAAGLSRADPLRSGRRTLAACLGALLIGLALIHVGAYASNALWGDTLTYGVAATFALQSDAVLAFLPVPEHIKRAALAIVGIGALTVGVLVALAARLLARPLAAAAADWLATADHHRPKAGRSRRAVALAGGLAFIAGCSGAGALVLATTRPAAVQGEPVTGFLGLMPAATLAELDNSRLEAAVADRRARTSYAAPARYERKNVILILSDALRADRMGVYGYSRATTPFLSRLREQGLLHRVDMALSTCSESFCGIASTLASRPYHQISVHNFKLHNLLRDIGYKVRFYLSGDHRAWSYLYDFYGELTAVDAWHDFWTLKSKDINDDLEILKALETVEPYAGTPGFFYFFLMSSHITGRRLPQYERFGPTHLESMRLLTFWNEVAGTKRLDGRVSAAGRLGPDELERISNRYDNGILQADAMMERIFAVLEAKGYLDDSIVVILGDHGEGLGEHGHIGHTRYLYQVDIRIPLLIYDRDAARYRNSAFATQIDVAPTIVDRLGLPVPDVWQGQSVLAPARDRTTIHQTRRGAHPCFAAVERRAGQLHKYQRCGGASGPVREELFDLVADPGERRNLIDQAPPELTARLRHEIRSRFAVVVNRCKSFECQD